MTATPPKKSDLGVRTVSAVVMVAVAGTALWLGGSVWLAFVGAVAAGVLWEWRGLVYAMTPSLAARIGWMVLGVIYIGVAAAMLMALRRYGMNSVLQLIGAVIATDIGAYFTGRTLGGPKIAPKVSPSKTWSGLLGGIVAAALVLLIMRPGGAHADDFPWEWQTRTALIGGALIAITAQAGDFFESWMKRRAGVKDSGQLIPGHGGLFDRVDGLLAVCFVLGIFIIASRVVG